MAAEQVPLQEIADMATLMKKWEEESSVAGYDPVPVLERMAEVVEAEMDVFNKMDPDPFDERHPSRADPKSVLGQVLKVIFKKGNFMDKLVNDYLRDNFWTRSGFPERDATDLNIAASRLVIDVMPGLEASAVFQTPEADSLIIRLFNWAEKAQDPLKTYAVGLLAAAMEIQDTAAVFREQNTKFVPLMLARLRDLQNEMTAQRMEKRPFAHLTLESTPVKKCRRTTSMSGSPRRQLVSPPRTPLLSPPPPPSEYEFDKIPQKVNGVMSNRIKEHDDKPEGDLMNTSGGIGVSESSNSSWAEMESYVIASSSIYPLTLAAKQVLILRYLTPMGEYQEFLSYIFEYNALSLIIKYMNIKETRETRLGFEALKYLAALLCHKKVSIEFINMGGLQRLLAVPRPSIAATGVSICLYYLAYCEDAMEKICTAPKQLITELVTYALWLMECSHNSGRCHATMFFGLSFQFRIILDEFDAQDGLRKLYNVISMLPILSLDDDARPVLNEDEESSLRQIVRHVIVALKRYFEAHLSIKIEYYMRLRQGTAGRDLPIPYRASRKTAEEVQEQIETLLSMMPFNASWVCVDQFQRLGGVVFLLQIIAIAYDWNFGGRAEIVQSVLNVLAISCVKPNVQLTFCERLVLPDQSVSVGMNIILGCCEGEIVPDAEVQKAALYVIINCVCAPTDRAMTERLKNVTPTSIAKRRFKSNEELLQKIWGSVRENNGIIVLLMLMMVKTPITDADALRALACRALSGLARCEKVRQIVSKLPALSNGSMQVALKDPILHEKRQEHVLFQKYYLALIDLITGKNQRTTCDDVSLTNIHRANVVAQTRINYNKQQLYELIHQQLINDGLTDTAAILHKEAGLTNPVNPLKPPTPAVVSFTTNRMILQRGSPKTPSTSRVLSTPTPVPSTPTSPIKLSLAKREKVPAAVSTPNRSLQKQTSWESSGPSKTPLMPSSLYLFPRERVSLHSIVTEYLTNQHALCKNPMVTCPQFNLFVPHKCPEPKKRIEAPVNHVMRLISRQTGFLVSNSMDNRLAHSRFSIEKTIRASPDGDSYFSCCYIPNSPYLVAGTNQGEIRVHNIHNGAEEATYQAHQSAIYHMEASQNGNLLLTSSSWRRPLCALWRCNHHFEMKTSFDDEEYVEFSKWNQDRVVGTKGVKATIFDVETGQTISKFNPVLSNTYSKNRATLNPSDELLLTDGVLFDVKSGREIHKLDKLNSVLSGVFHPNGLEILSNTEVWDLRTFHLLRTVQALDQQQLTFNSTGTVVYTYSVEQESDMDTIYETSFKTLDLRDYSSIATIDTKKLIYNIACNVHDSQIAVVENQGEQDNIQETAIRLYAVGRRRDTEDEVEEEEEEDVSDDGSNSGSNSDDNLDRNDLLNIDDVFNQQSDNEGNEDNDDESYEEEFLLDYSSDEGSASSASSNESNNSFNVMMNMFN